MTLRRANRGRPPPTDAGLTLLETLIVLAVIAIAAGATTLSLSPRRGNATEVEARLLAGAIQAAADRDIATGARAVLVVDAHGYAVGGGPRHALPADTVVDTPSPALPLAGVPFDLVVAHGSDRWRVAFDGVRAVAALAGDAA